MGYFAIVNEKCSTFVYMQTTQNDVKNFIKKYYRILEQLVNSVIKRS